ncbi:MAG: fibronectin type III domain-containing protein [Dehalococcoidia bacterium]
MHTNLRRSLRLPLRVLPILLLFLVLPSLSGSQPVLAQTVLPGIPYQTYPYNGSVGVSSAPSLYWDAVAEANYYYVQYYDVTANGGIGSTSELYSTTVTLYGLVAGHLYNWAVFACSYSYTYCSNSPTYWNFTVYEPPPGVPYQSYPPSESQGLSSSPALYWNAASGAAYYYLGYYDATVGGQQIDTGDIYATSGTLFNLTAGHQYGWAVFACNSGGYSNSPTYWYFTVYEPPPGVPYQIAPANGSTGVSSTPTLSWQAAANADDYYVEYYDTNTGQTQYTSYLYSTSTSLFGLNAGHTYLWAVFATNSGGYANTGFWSFTVYEPPPGVPYQIAPANGSTGVSSTPTLSWQAAANADDYYVEYYDTNTGQVQYTSLVYSTSTSLTGLRPGDTYLWAVFANNSSGYANTGFWSFTVYAATPGAPQPYSPANASTNTGTTPVLSWYQSANAVSGDTEYILHVIDAQTYTDFGPYTTIDPSTQFQVPGGILTPGRSYFWELYACTGQVCSAWSNLLLFTTVPPPSAASETSPANGQDISGTSVNLTWNAPASNDYQGQTHYYVDLYDQNRGQYLQQNYDAQTNQSDAVSSLTSGDTYLWNVVACNGIDQTQDCTTDSWYDFIAQTNQTHLQTSPDCTDSGPSDSYKYGCGTTIYDEFGQAPSETYTVWQLRYMATLGGDINNDYWQLTGAPIFDQGNGHIAYNIGPEQNTHSDIPGPRFPGYTFGFDFTQQGGLTNIQQDATVFYCFRLHNRQYQDPSNPNHIIPAGFKFYGWASYLRTNSGIPRDSCGP